jgi:hypothetical protein
MKQLLYACLFLLVPALASSQYVTRKIMPYVYGTTAGKEGQVEAGPEFSWMNTIKGTAFSIRPAVRMPMTETRENNLKVDRFSPVWKAVLAAQYGHRNTWECTTIRGLSVGVQAEYGMTDYKYYPTGSVNSLTKESLSSYSVEVKIIGFFTKKEVGSRQYSPQFRLRYSRNANASDPIGIVNPVDAMGLTTTSMLVLNKPFTTSIISPALALHIYPGRGNFTYSPSIYYDLVGSGSTNQNASYGRVRLEYGVNFYPLIKEQYINFGISPFVSLRTNGTDNFKNVEYGGQITIRFGTAFLQGF